MTRAHVAPLVCITMLLAPPLAIASAPVSTPEPAVAAPTEENGAEAKRLRTEAEAHFFADEFDDAIAKFQQAHDLAPHPTDLFNMGRIHEEQGDLGAALRLYEEFVEQPRLSLADRAAAVERIQVLRVVVKPESRASGPAAPRVVAEGDTGKTKPSRTPADRGPRSSTVARPLVISGATLLGFGAAVAAAGGVGFGLAARRNSDKVAALADGSNPGRLTLAEAERIDARGRDFATLQITFLVGGSVLALVGAGLLTGGLVKRKRSGLQALTPTVGPRTVALNAAWRF